MFDRLSRTRGNDSLRWLHSGVALSALSILAAFTVPATADELGMAYTQDVFHTARGGLRTGTAYLNNIDIAYTHDIDDGARGTFFAYALYNNGNTFSDTYAGDVQVASNIDAGRALRLFELWYDYPVAHNVSVLFGLFDLNSEFDSIETAALFLNSSHGIGADFSLSGENGPSIFPSTSLAARLRWDIDDRNDLRYAVFDAVPGDPDDPTATTVDLGQGVLQVLEYNHRTPHGMRLGIGGWHYSNDFVRLDGSGPDDRDKGNLGVYAFADALLAHGETNAGYALNGYVRYGVATPRFNPVERYAGAGAVLSSFSRSRPDDRLGLAIAHAVASASLRRAGVALEQAETTIELTYSAPLQPWLRIQPSVQYIKNPSFDSALKDALVVGVRFEFSVTQRF